MERRQGFGIWLLILVAALVLLLRLGPRPALELWTAEELPTPENGLGRSRRGDPGDEGIALLDLDGDGLEDIVSVAASRHAGDGLRAWRLDEEGRASVWSDEALAAVKGPCRAFAVGDLDGDGAMDLWVAREGRDALLVRREQGFVDVAEAVHADPGARAHDGVRLADFDRDGRLDAFTWTRGDPELLGTLWLQTERARWSARAVGRAPSDGAVPSDAPVSCADALAFDVDRDQRVDLLVVDSWGRVFVLAGRGDGSLEPPRALGGPRPLPGTRTEGGATLAVGDLLGDGSIAWLALSRSGIASGRLVREGEGAVRTEDLTPRLLAAGLDTESLVGSALLGLEDLDADGELDLIVASAGADPSALRLLRGVGGGRVRAVGAAFGELVSRRDRWAAVACLDVDRDGRLDVIATRRGGAAPVVFRSRLEARPTLALRLEGDVRSARPSPRDATGASLTLELAGRRRAAVIGSNRGPGSASVVAAARFAVPNASSRSEESVRQGRVRIRWPSGEVEERSLPWPPAGVWQAREGEEGWTRAVGR